MTPGYHTHVCPECLGLWEHGGDECRDHEPELMCPSCQDTQAVAVTLNKDSFHDTDLSEPPYDGTPYRDPALYGDDPGDEDDHDIHRFADDGGPGDPPYACCDNSKG